MVASPEIRIPKKPEDGVRSTKRAAVELYGIEENDGEFVVTLPGLVDHSDGAMAVVGTCTERFSDRAAAEERATQSRDNLRIARERASLDKTYAGNTFFNIQPTTDGRYKVTVPGGVDDTGRFYMATTSFEFSTWDEAKAYFLSTVEAGERVIDRPLLRLQTTADTTISFSELTAFHPQVAAAEQAQLIPPAIEQYLMRDGRLDGSAPSAKTYQETIKEAGWERKLYSFILKFLKNEGAETAKALGIKELDALSPSQAVELATALVVDLTKYKWSDTAEVAGDIAITTGSAADNSTVLQLLQQGLRRRGDPTWEGNGVCRNFASAVKAVFEALKANQTKFNRLRNTYALYEHGNDSFAPEREDFGTLKKNRVGHAWNSFVTVARDGSANTTITDVTWAKRDLDSKKITGLDHTLMRMEPVVRAVALAMPETAPNRSEQLTDILKYYVVKIDGAHDQLPELPPVSSLSESEQDYYRAFAVENFGKTYDLRQLDDSKIIAAGQQLYTRIRHDEKRGKERLFFTTKAVELMGKQGVPAELPDGLVSAINEQYQTIAGKADRREITTIYRIAERDPRINFRTIIQAHLKEASLTNYHADKLIFSDDGLQRMVFEELKNRPGFDILVKDSPKFRIRLREALPELFLDFVPDTKPEDAAELRYLVSQTNGLQRLRMMVERPIRSGQSYSGLFERARGMLREINPDRYDASIKTLTDYEVIKQFDELAARLRAQSN